MKRSNLTLIVLAAVGLAFGGGAHAQGSHEEHHPGGAAAETAQGQTMPMEKGMKPSEMPGGGMMGKGMMKDGQMGPGMMGPGKMGKGMMGGNCPMMGMMAGSDDQETHASGRIAFIKAELGITEEQQKVFDAYAAALKKNLDGMHAMRATMMSSMQSGTPVERLEAHVKAMEGRLASLKEVKPAVAGLYDALDEAQKKKADKILTGMGCMM
ncbi:MAG: Spy/CpxP family protein refolding chaperone [Alphaproteobacteria bacterium]|nr:Spy/CpxP family protein refolding chaperone [Alphaproteobacteria bacterium]